MNDQQHAFWLAYIRQLADLLGLKDYDAQLLREPPELPEAVAFVWTRPEVLTFSVRLSERFLHLTDPEEQRQMVTHELLHVHMTAIDAHVRWGVQHLPTDSLVDALPDLIRMDIERATDALSHALARFLPLPQAVTVKMSYARGTADSPLVTVAVPGESSGYNGSIHEAIDSMPDSPRFTWANRDPLERPPLDKSYLQGGQWRIDTLTPEGARLSTPYAEYVEHGENHIKADLQPVATNGAQP